MKLLLDTHIFLWYVSGDARLPAKYQLVIQDPANDVFLSAASIWEAVIKHMAGNLPLPGPAANFLVQQRVAHRIHPLAIDEGAMTYLAGLPRIHRDPFDRLLISQAQQHGLTILTVDANVAAYGVPVLPVA